jgi:hypothetical protein
LKNEVIAMKKKQLANIFFIIMISLILVIIGTCQKSPSSEEKKKIETQVIPADKTLSQQQPDTERVAFDKIKKCIEPNFRRKRLPMGEKAYISNPTSPIGLFQEGFLFSMERFLDSMKIRVQEIQPSRISSELVKEVSFLIVPGAGLRADTPSSVFDGLKSYAMNGGTVFIFSQPLGIAYSKLMEGVEAMGFQEDKTHNFIKIVMVDGHPMFEGIPQKSFIMAFDGHFTKYPEKAKVYLKRERLGQAVALGYPLGKGLIIATTSFTPDDFDSGYATEDNIIFFREIFNYFMLPIELIKIKAGEKAKIKIMITNKHSKKNAVKANVEIYDPDWAFRRFYKEFPINLKPGDSTFIELEYHTCPTARPGIWHITYRLMTKEYQLLTSEQEPKGVNVLLETSIQSRKEALDGRFIVK